jgi:hypothetical protein
MAIIIFNKNNNFHFEKSDLINYNISSVLEKKWGVWNVSLGFTNDIEKTTSTYEHETIQSILIGTPLYKNIRHCDILKELTIDFYNKTLDYSVLKGNFLLAIYDGRSISLFNDKTGQQNFFYRKTDSVISNSFLLLIQSSKEVLTINNLALKEKILTGFNIGNETVINQIEKLNSKNFSKFNISDITFFDYKIDYNKIITDIKNNANLESQVKSLESLFENIDATFSDKVGDLGLSGGFDCRLVLALARKKIKNKIHLHSHSTKGVHESEILIARQLSEEYGAKLNTIPTKKITDLNDEQVKEILIKNLYFFDGRSARHLGAYSETYTYEYKKSSQALSYYSLNGLGGEIFRDSYFIGNKTMSWKDWAPRFLYLQLSTEIISNSSFKELDEYLQKKLKNELDFDLRKLDILTTHAYYSLIKMPQCNGNLVAAYSKVSPFIAPFFEFEIVTKALESAKKMGLAGGFQARMITKIDSRLAEIKSNYGKSFINLGLKYFLWAKIKTIGSLSARNKMVNKQLLKKENSKNHLKVLNQIENNIFLNQSKNILLKFVPDLDFNKALLDSTQTRNLIFTMVFLNEIANKLRENEEI